jgi:hypothetical protein
MDISPFQDLRNLGGEYPYSIRMTKKEKDALRAREWRAANPEKWKAIYVRSIAKHHERILARRRRKYRENPEKDYERHRQFCANNPGYHARWHKECRKRDPERYKKYELRRVRPPGQRNASLRKWSAKKQATDLNWRLTKNLRTRLWWALKKDAKSASTIALLGCNSIEDFRIYLETLFEVGMSWENYGNKTGQWSVDHIIPCDLFDMTNPDHQKRCFHFSNLRPMWHVDNLRKGARTAATTK